MNILIPNKWLLEQLETTLKPEKIQEFVSLCGPSVERIYQRGNDEVYDIEITTNRVDSMSVRGIAREAAVILEQFDVPAKLVSQSLLKKDIPKPTDSTKTLQLPKIIDQKKLCRRTMCVVLRDVQRTATPKWMADRLSQIELNVHESAIDITNYVTHELGHPIHAFDYDQVMKLGGEINITEAKKGDEFTTLDGESYTCVGGEVVFKNPEGVIIDLPSIKGTSNTSINDSTKNILLWIEAIHPSKVRFASMTHAIRTVAAQLSEKGIDSHLAEPTLVKAVQLYQELCDVQIASEVYDDFSKEEKLATIIIDLKKIQDYLGISIEKSQVVSILEKLECQVNAVKNTLHVTPPSFRKDLTIPADIVEEIARIYGYHNLPSVLMPTRIPLNKPKDVNFEAEEKTKHFLADTGWFEIYSYSMVSEQLAKNSAYKIEEHLKLANSLTEDKVYLRRSLIPSLEEMIEKNPQEENLSVFELANVYHPRTDQLPLETLYLGMVSQKSLRKTKGDLSSLLQKFYITDFEVKQKTDENRGKILVGKIEIGKIWIDTLKGTGKKMTCIEIEMKALLPLIKTHPAYKALPKTASIKEQLTFTLPAKTQIGPVLQTIREIDGNIKQVTLDDVYQANHTFSIEYWNEKKNLSNELIKPLREKIVKTIEKDYSAKLVGKI
ncbi:MAG: phenylalanine--tRNA ligase subunit beta [Candidatus Pacebacteria bacterium]|jgi:phenylalanyl-tRNA synthetase beta chain|nr:phenylalanine--tRNA ligase subunit beta [Candidatus Paceibacterota bacterium]MBT4652655.1 phenylalanine--tRNA ligase subunit beta [Candidatus Paceibacterota bacterium]MBT6755812.1 phenylalanine--tRNA ligase subunit beta [Candidatus Paceibacterota bacterium]MBT6921025.1 phenylalanine--tRNA ligase subunit beta [Candidatus Paceibacterota bacterium]